LPEIDEYTFSTDPVAYMITPLVWLIMETSLVISKSSRLINSTYPLPEIPGEKIYSVVRKSFIF
jgi:hypothetical protein